MSKNCAFDTTNLFCSSRYDGPITSLGTNYHSPLHWLSKRSWLIRIGFLARLSGVFEISLFSLDHIFAPLKSPIYSSTPEQDRALSKPEYSPIKQYTHTISFVEPPLPLSSGTEAEGSGIFQNRN